MSAHAATKDGLASLSDAVLPFPLCCFLCDALIELVDLSEQSFTACFFCFCDRPAAALFALVKSADDRVCFL